ncbi:MAG: acid phosphatase family membrane protein YuiD [Candidatus Omnitrophota bacterium]|jgi:acid phosphatase family membrane protein YuiD
MTEPNFTSYMLSLVQNPCVVSGFWGWGVAQLFKVILGVVRERRFDFKWFVGSGGMPSSHAALVMGVATSIGLISGFGTPLFALALMVAFITMFDAQGVRRQSGRQASALNQILDDLAHNKGIQQEPLKELFGHTPVEVIAGGILGVCVAIAIT